MGWSQFETRILPVMLLPVLFMTFFLFGGTNFTNDSLGGNGTGEYPYTANITFSIIPETAAIHWKEKGITKPAIDAIFENVSKGTHNFTISAEGYIPQERQIPVGEFEPTHFEVCLAELPPPPPEEPFTANITFEVVPANATILWVEKNRTTRGENPIFEDVPEGTHTFIFSAEGYALQELEVFVEESRPTTFEVWLEPEEEELSSEESEIMGDEFINVDELINTTEEFNGTIEEFLEVDDYLNLKTFMPTQQSGCGEITSDIILTSSISASGTCFNITADNVVFDCSNYVVVGNGAGHGFVIEDRKGITIKNCNISAFSEAVYWENTHNGTIQNNTFWNNTDGIYMDPSYNNTIIENQFFNNSQDGLHLDDSHNNTIRNNTAYNNSRYGFFLNASTNNTLINNTAYNNTFNGFSFRDANNNKALNNTIHGNSASGFRLYSSSGNNLTNNRAYNNTGSGFYLLSNSDNNILTNNTAFSAGTAAEGFRVRASDNNTIADSLAYDNLRGFRIQNSANNTLAGNTAYNNTEFGFLIDTGSYNNITNCTSYNNTNAGFVFLGGTTNNNLINSTSYRNQKGIYLLNSNNSVFTAATLYNNNYDFIVNNTGGSPIIFNMTNSTFRNPSGTLENYTRLSLGDSVAGSASYSINWTSNSSTLPTDRFSFRQKFVNISNQTGTVSIDEIVWHWNQSEITGSYNESQFELWKYNASGWLLLNNTPDISANTLTQYNLNPASEYGILQNGANAPTFQGDLDLNNDGYKDIVFTNYFDDIFSNINSIIYYGSGSGFKASQNSTLPTFGGRGLAVADLNDDGYLDIVFANYNSNLIFLINSTIYWGTPTGYSPANRTGLPTQGARGAPSIADLNRDGYLDIVFCNYYNGSITDINSFIYWGTPSGYSTSNRTSLPTRGAMASHIADLNNDGYLDMFISEYYSNATASFNINSSIYWNSPGGFNSSNKTELPTSGATGSSIADLNKDGYLDIVVGQYYNGSSGNINSTIYWGSASGFNASNRLELPTNASRGNSIADLNKDGYLDIVFSNYYNGVTWNLNSTIYWGSASGFNASNFTGLPTSGAVGNSVAVGRHIEGNTAFASTGGATLIPDWRWYMDTNLTNVFDLDIFFHDSDDDPLNYSVSGNMNITVQINPTTHLVTFVPAPGWHGNETIHFSASDGASSAYSNNVTLYVLRTESPHLCTIISSPGTYQLSGNAEGAPIPASPRLGTVCIKIATSNVLFDCNGYNITNNGTSGTTRGILLNGSLTNITVKNCPNIAHYNYSLDIYRSNNSLFANITVYNNSMQGFLLDESHNNTLANNTAYKNGMSGFSIHLSHDNNLTNNTAYNHSENGFHLSSSNSNTLSLNYAYNNTMGIYLQNVHNHTLINNTIYDSKKRGISFWNSTDTAFYNTTLYNNKYDIYIRNTQSTPMMYNMSNTTVRNPSGSLQNYTILSINDIVEASTTYTINWTTNSSTLPTDRFSFRQKFVNISTVAGTPLIEQITWHWLETELAGYNDTYFELWKYNASDGWTLRNNTPNTSANTLTQYNMNPASDYAILQFNASSCMVLNSSGNYFLNTNLAGAPINVPNVPVLTNACIVVASSDVEFSCDGYNITNDGTANAAGILINGSASLNYTNITIRNCPGVSHYRYGVFAYDSSEDAIQNTTVFNASKAAFHTISSSNITFINNTARDGNCPGFYIHDNSNYVLLENNIVYNSSTGFTIYQNSGYARIINNTAHNNTHGFFIRTSNYTILTNNTAHNNSLYGFRIVQSSGNNLTSNNLTNNGGQGINMDAVSSSNTLSSNYICFNTNTDLDNNNATNAGTLDTCGSWNLWNESGHPGCTFRCTEVWQYFYGDVNGSLLLAPTQSDIFYSWNWSGQNGKVYVLSENATIDWPSIIALGRNTSEQNSTNDFTELDTLLGISTEPDNINYTYSYDGSNPLQTQNWTLFEHFVPYLPVANSSVFNNGFLTGIAWDSSQDGGGGQFNISDNEDVVFISQINGSAPNDYEIRVPAALATYKGGSVVEFWVELD